MKAVVLLLVVALASIRSASSAILVPGSVLQTWTDLCSKDPTGNWALTKEVKSCGRRSNSGDGGCSMETVYFNCPRKRTTSAMQAFPRTSRPFPGPIFGSAFRRSAYSPRPTERRSIAKKFGDWIHPKCCDLRVSCPPRGQSSRRSPLISDIIKDFTGFFDRARDRIKAIGREQMKNLCCSFDRACPFGPTKKPSA